MPKLINRKGDSCHFVTALDGPWQVYTSKISAVGMLRQQVGIVNIRTGVTRAFEGNRNQGSRRANPFASAKKEAEKRNLAERRRVTRDGHLGYNHQYIRADIIRALIDITTMPGAACYEGGVPGLVRRIEEINKISGELLQTLRETDMFEASEYGIMNEWAVLNGGDIDLRESQQAQR